MADIIRLRVSWRGTHIAEMEVSGSDERVSSMIVQRTEEEVGTLYDAKVLISGKRIPPGTSLAALFPSRDTDEYEAVVFGPLQEDAAQIQQAGLAMPRLKDDLADNSAPAHRNVPSSSSKPRSLRPQTYGFGAIVPLEGLPDVEQARGVLEAIASDRRVLAVMKERKWYVPVLREMYPSGKVGVDPVCVLGLNVNKGAEIQLRIRTDDLLGFRKMGVVMKTVWHELAHNVISEHTGEFYGLVSELERQGEAADWTKSRGHVVGLPPTGPRPAVPLPPHHPTGAPSTLPPPALGTTPRGAADLQVQKQAEPAAAMPPPSPAPVPPRPGPLVEDMKEDDLPPEVVAAMRAAAARIDRLHACCTRLRADCATAGMSYASALTLLAGVLTRAGAAVRGEVQGEQGDKVRAIRPGNSAFLRGTAGSVGAIDFLQACGFQSTTRAAASGGPGPGPGGVQWLELPPRADPGGLWLGLSVLEKEAQGVR